VASHWHDKNKTEKNLCKGTLWKVWHHGIGVIKNETGKNELPESGALVGAPSPLFWWFWFFKKIVQKKGTSRKWALVSSKKWHQHRHGE